jgi:hypothetical protein
VLAERMAGIVMTLRIRLVDGLVSRTEEIVYQKATVKKQWDDGLLIDCRTDPNRNSRARLRDLDCTALNLAWRQK